MTELEKKFTHLKSLYIRASRAVNIIYELNQTILTNMKIDLASAIMCEDSSGDSSRDFKYQQYIFFGDKNISDYKNFLKLAKKIKKIYHSLPIELKDFTFNKNLLLLLNMLSTYIEEKLSDYLNSLSTICNERKALTN